MQALINSINSAVNALWTWLGAIWDYLTGALQDVALWCFDQLMSIRDVGLSAVANALGSWNTFTLGALYSALPPDIGIILWRIGIPDFLAVVSAALLTRLTVEFLKAFL